MNYGLHTIDHNFINSNPFGMFHSDLERELHKESTPVNNGKMIATGFLHIFTWPVINAACLADGKINGVISTDIHLSTCIIVRLSRFMYAIHVYAYGAK